MIKKVVLKKEEEIFDNTNIYCLVNIQGEIFKLSYFKYDKGYLFTSLRYTRCSFGNMREDINSLFYELKNPDSGWGENKIYEFESEEQFSMWYYFIVNHQPNQIMKNTDYGEPKEIKFEHTIHVDDVDIHNKIYCSKDRLTKEIYKLYLKDLPKTEYYFGTITRLKKHNTEMFNGYTEAIKYVINQGSYVYQFNNIFEAIEFYKKQEDK